MDMAAEGSTGSGPPRLAPGTRSRRSHVWPHFNCFTADDGKDKAECKRCRLVLGADTRNGTSTLRKHLRICKGPAGGCRSGSGTLGGDPRPAQQTMPSRPGGSSVGGSDILMDEHDCSAITDLASMIASNGYDSSIMEDVYFRTFVSRLNPEFKMPSRAAIQRICDGIFDGERRDVLSRLRRAPGRVSIAVGAVKAMGTEVVYTACHFIDDEWNLRKEILDAYMVGTFPYNHGPLLGLREASLNLLSYKGFIEDVIMDISKIGIIPNMLFMIASEAVDMPGLSSTCAVTRGIDCYTFADILLHSIARSLSNEIEIPIFEVNCELQTHLHLTRQKREDLLSDLGLHYSLRDYNEFWYSCYCSLQVHRSAEVTPATTNTESEFREVMRKLLDAMYHAIQDISASTTPTSNLCLVELFKLRELLQTEAARAVEYEANTYGTSNGSASEGNKKMRIYNEIKQDALRVAKDTLDKALRGSYLIWSIPLALDPRYKLRYLDSNFQRAFGDEAAGNYISEVTEKIEELYKDYAQDDDATVTLVCGGNDPLQRAWDEHRRATQSGTDLDRYLNDEPISPNQGFDILNWWKINSQSYPTVARMARDALAMPTCSKLSSEQISHVMSIVRGYSNEPFVDAHYKK